MRECGRIIMIGSSVGERIMMPGLVPCAATKGAVKIFTQGLAREVGSRGILSTMSSRSQLTRI